MTLEGVHKKRNRRIMKNEYIQETTSIPSPFGGYTFRGIDQSKTADFLKY